MGVKSLPVVLVAVAPFDPFFAGVRGSFFLRACFYFRPLALLLSLSTQAISNRPRARGKSRRGASACF